MNKDKKSIFESMRETKKKRDTRDIKISVSSFDKNLISYLEKCSFNKYKITDNVILKDGRSPGISYFTFPPTVDLILTLSTGVVVGLVANWIYDTLKGKNATLIIERTEVKIERGEIKKVIKEKMKIEQ